MNSSNDKIHEPKAQGVTVTEDSVIVDLTDGRSVSAPLAWYPRLLHGKPEERDHWRLVGGGGGIHWPDLDEDLSVESLTSGRPSGESAESFKRWLETRKSRRKGTRSASRERNLQRPTLRKASRR